MYKSRSETAAKVYSVKVYNPEGKQTDYISWGIIEARDHAKVNKELTEVRHHLKTKRSIVENEL